MRMHCMHAGHVSSPIFLYENQLFLTFRHREVSVCNFRGETVATFADHVLKHPDTNTNNTFISSTQDYIISYCRERHPRRNRAGVQRTAPAAITAAMVDGDPHGEEAGSTDEYGEETDAAEGGAPSDVVDHRRGTINVSHILSGRCVAKIASDGDELHDVTSLYFSEERNELYVGNKQGMLHVWSQGVWQD